MKTNPRPVYFAIPYCIPETNTLVPNWFSVYELVNGESRFMFKMSNQGDRLNNILKRGIPMDEAKKLFYEMDSQ